LDRRHVLIALGAAAAFRAALAQQQGKVWRIGFLGLRSRPSAENPDPYYDAFVDQLRRLGYVEGKNLVIEGRFADGKYDRLPGFAAELVRAQVDIIVSHGTPGPRAALAATSTIPVVGLAANDPVASGMTTSLSRPGGNFTGLSLISVDVTQKQLDLLKTLRPRLSRVAVLMNPSNPSHPELFTTMKAAAAAKGIEVLPVEASTAEEIDRAFVAVARERPHGLLIMADSFFIAPLRNRQIARLANAQSIPSISPWREYVLAGGLMSYGQNIAEYYRRGAEYVDKILKGTKPGDLPIEQPSNIYLAINRKTATALRLAIPNELLLRVDEVID
jgi:putative ABC transport system substrate-binding protein